jgi:hydrogenase-4 component B
MFYRQLFFMPNLFTNDILSYFFVFVTLLISIPSAIYSLGYLKGSYNRSKISYAWAMTAVFVLSMLVVVSAGNAILFLIAWELMSLASFFLVIFDSEHWESIKAGIIYIVMTHIGTAFITAAFLIINSYSHSFDFTALAQACRIMPGPTRDIVFLFFLVGFGTKAGVVPLHVWLPYAHPQAPSHISSIMSGVMIKTAIYGLIRFVIVILGVQTFWWGNLVLILASVSCLVGVMYALTEHDIKKLLAYHSVENIGIILLGVGVSMVFLKLGMAIPAVLAMTAGLYHLVNHAIFKSLLFLCAGNIYKSTGLRDIEKMGGLIKLMPWTAAAFLIGSMAISALPPMNGFVSEWLTLQALFSGVLHCTGGVKILMGLYASVLALTGGLAAACFVKAFGITFLALPRSEKAKEAKEVSPVMLYATVSMAVLSILFGLLAVPITRLISGVSEFTTALGANGFDFTIRGLAITPSPAGGAALSNTFIALILVISAISIIVLSYIFLGRRRIVTAKTWGCGYYNLDERTEYTATAFSKPFRIALNFFYRPYRKTAEIKDSFYHVRSLKYETKITPVFKKYIYELIIKRVFGTANFVRKFQSGSIHFYLAYIFIAIILLLVFRNLF